MRSDLHTCEGTDDDGAPLKPEAVTCGNCELEWCERCDPCPSALCPKCHGRGYTTAPLDEDGVRDLENGKREFLARMATVARYTG
jgi:hypothetical protein